jgi:Tol biopolymer transport system component
LRAIGMDGSGDRQLTFGDTSHVAPDAHSSGKIVSCRIRTASDIWKFPTSGTPPENVRDGIRITNQTGQVQTPSVSPDGRELVFISDNGVHANLWIARTDGSDSRQLTFERDRGITIGVPLWSPAGDRIAFVCAQQMTEIRVINPNGRGLRTFIPDGFGPCWSRDGRWLYYTRSTGNRWRIEKLPVAGGEPMIVRDGGYLHSPVAGDSTLFFAARSGDHAASIDWTIYRASPEDGPAEAIGRIAAVRVPVSTAFVHGSLSPDGKLLALPLIDGATVNVWGLSTDGSGMIPLTDFGGRSTLIARQVSWSPDGKFIYAAVADVGGDVVMYDGLL